MEFFGQTLFNNISFQFPVQNETTRNDYLLQCNIRFEQEGTVVNTTKLLTFTQIDIDSHSHNANSHLLMAKLLNTFIISRLIPLLLEGISSIL
ncbi:hypothetical protein CH372_12370 [Leptospira meyeri]|nr:hypothetical protein CH372_12370 [Leptospira meyeri]PKA26818.1 hypothetical protein CH381_08640 [Leptospira sp. mixed culture ATI2-C-A1]